MRSTPQQFSLYRTSEKQLFTDIPKKNSLLFGKIYDIIEGKSEKRPSTSRTAHTKGTLEWS